VYKIEKGKRVVFPFPAPKNTVKFNFTNAILGKYIGIKQTRQIYRVKNQNNRQTALFIKILASF